MHVDTNHGDLLVRRHARRHHDPRRRRRAMTGRASSRWTSRGTRAAQDGVADVHARASRRAGKLIRERAGQGARRAAAQRDLRLRRQGLDRTDHADAGDPVRLPVRRAAQADALVRRRDRAAQERHRRIAGAAPRRRWTSARAYFAKLWNERVKAEPRNDLISMMAHSEATRHMDAGQSDGQHHPADRRRQRHHPQHHERARCWR